MKPVIDEELLADIFDSENIVRVFCTNVESAQCETTHQNAVVGCHSYYRSWLRRPLQLDTLGIV